MKPSHEQLKELLRTVAATAPAEIDCDEFLARAGHYLETLDRTAELSVELRAAAQHLEVCPGCREEFDALLELHLGS